MARTWQELFDTGEEAPPPAAAGEDGEAERGGFFRRLRDNMSKTRQALGAELQTTVFQSLDDEAFEKLEETLIYADVGAPTTARIVERLETEAESGELTGGEELSRRLRELLADTARLEGDTIPLTEHPTVILVTGVNGSGKTTTIGKIAWHLQKELGRSVLLAAGDTFRAAAAEQLTLWAERAGCELVRGEAGSDPGRRGLRRDRGGQGARPRRGDRGHRRAPPHPAAPDGRAAQGAQGDRAPGCRARRTRRC